VRDGHPRFRHSARDGDGDGERQARPANAKAAISAKAGISAKAALSAVAGGDGKAGEAGLRVDRPALTFSSAYEACSTLTHTSTSHDAVGRLSPADLQYHCQIGLHLRDLAAKSAQASASVAPSLTYASILKACSLLPARKPISDSQSSFYAQVALQLAELAHQTPPHL
jgi:hypothetical protein